VVVVGPTLLIDGVPWRPIPVTNFPGAIMVGVDDTGILVSAEKGKAGICVIRDGQTAPTIGATVRVRCVTALPTELSPIYFDGHPIDLLQTLWTLGGRAYDASACATLKNLIGAQYSIALRITDIKSESEFIRQTVLQPFGVGLRVQASGALEPFSTRLFANTPPATTIGDADVVEGGTSLPFELDPANGVSQVKIQMRLLQALLATTGLATGQAADKALDAVVESTVSYNLFSSDTAVVPSGIVTIDMPGMIHKVGSFRPVDPTWFEAIAAQFFDRFGRGAVAGETILLREPSGTTDGVKLGDEILLDIAQLPNHNKRLGDDPAIAARAMQVIRLTETPSGRLVRLLDSGPNLQPLPTVPTLSIARSSDSPRRVAEVTVTNAATLNGLGYAVRIQMAITTGAAPAAGDYTDVLYFRPAAIPTGVTRLPIVVAGRTVYVKARSELITTGRPSNYGTAVNVALFAVDNPTSVASATVAGDGSLRDMTWVIGANATLDLTDIFLRLNGQAFGLAVKVETLPAGSTQYRLQGLIPGTAYIASVQHRDPRTLDTSDPVDVSFTATATTRTLNAPIHPHEFAGSLSDAGVPVIDGTYGIAVAAREIPGFVEVAVAVETAPGAGTYGSFDTVARVPSVQADWTKVVLTAPNDGKKRQLKARHVADGATASVYTNTVTVLPWTMVPLPPITDTDLSPIRIIITKTEYDAGASKWRVWFRFFVTDGNGVETEPAETTTFNSLLSPYIPNLSVTEQGTGTPASGLSWPHPSVGIAYENQELGWPVSWNSTNAQAWDYLQTITTVAGFGISSIASFTKQLTVPAANSGDAPTVDLSVTPVDVALREVGFDATRALAAVEEYVHYEKFLVPAFAGGLPMSDDAAADAALAASFAENKVILMGSRSVTWTTPKIMRGPGMRFTPSSGGGAGANGIYYTGTGIALTIQGDPTPGSDAARVTELDITITGDGQVATGFYANFVTFSHSSRIRVANFKGTGVLLEKYHDCLTGEISVENCGWSSYGNFKVTGVDDGLNLEAPAFVRQGAGGDTSNESPIARVQIEQARFKALVDGGLANVVQNIHSERLMFSSNDTTAWFFTGARCEYNQARLHANSNKNLIKDSENLGSANWVDNGTPTRTAKVSIEGDIILDEIGDDDGAAFEWKEQTVAGVTLGEFGFQGKASVVSSGADTRNVTISGILAVIINGMLIGPGAADTEVLTLNGTTEVVGAKTWYSITSAVAASTSATRTVTVRGGGVDIGTIATNVTNATDPKGFSFVVQKPTTSPSSYSEIQLQDATASTQLATIGITWSGNVPVPTIVGGAGTGLSLEQLRPTLLAAGKYRIKISSLGADPSHTVKARIFPAGNGTAGTGRIRIGGIQVENTRTCGELAKSGSASVTGLDPYAADEWATALLAGETMTYNDFNVEGKANVQTFGSASTTIKINNPNFNGRLHSDFSGGGGPIVVAGGRVVVVKTGIDPALEVPLYFTDNCQIGQLAVGDCGNPGLARRFKLADCRVGLLTSDSTNSGAELVGCLIDNIRDGCQYQTILRDCTVLGSTGGSSANTWTVRGYAEIDGGIIVPAVACGSETVKVCGGANLAALISAANPHAVLLAPGLRLGGGQSGLAQAPGATPNNQSQWGNVFKKGDILWNYAFNDPATDPIFWFCKTAGAPGTWVAVMAYAAGAPVEGPTGTTVPIRTSAGELRATSFISELGGHAGRVYFGSSKAEYIDFNGTNWLVLSGGSFSVPDIDIRRNPSATADIPVTHTLQINLNGTLYKFLLST
jgi:hypothetical protein